MQADRVSEESSWSEPQPVRSARTGRQLALLLLAIVVGLAAVAGLGVLIARPLSAVTSPLAGLFAPARPPAVLTSSARDVASQIRHVSGVKSVAWKVEQPDLKDHPTEWEASLVVTASSARALGTVPAAILAITSGTSNMRVDVTVPAGAGEAASQLGDLSSAMTQTVSALRSIPGVREVFAQSADDVLVKLKAGLGLTQAVTAVRPALAQAGSAGTTLTLMPQGAGDQDVMVNVTATWPSADLLAVLDSVDRDPATTSLSTSAPGPGATSWFIGITTSKPDEVDSALVSIASDPAEPTKFMINGLSDVAGSYNGTVGQAAPSG